MTILDSRPAMTTSLPDEAAPDAPNSRSATSAPTPMVFTPSGPDSGRHVPSDTHGVGAAGSNSPAANGDASTIVKPPQGSQPTGGPNTRDAHGGRAAGSNVPGPAAIEPSTPNLESLLDPALCLAADILDDIERVRIANENRLRQLTRSGEDADGEERGFGLTEDHPDVARLAAMVETLRKVEHDATLNLQRKVRKHPLGVWAKGQRGVGEKQIARLLAAIGDPYINSAKGEPRTVSALWAYSGLHVLSGGHADVDAQGLLAAGDQHRDTDQSGTDAPLPAVGVAAKRRKGERANWSTKAKMRAYLIAESCIKQLGADCRDGHWTVDAQTGRAVPVQAGEQELANAVTGPMLAAPCSCSPYRVVYDQRRAHTAITHPEWTDGHSHNDALRVASKEILKDLWRAARDWHHQEEQ